MSKEELQYTAGENSSLVALFIWLVDCAIVQSIFVEKYESDIEDSYRSKLRLTQLNACWRFLILRNRTIYGNEGFVPLVLVGNKCDLEDDRVVTKDQGSQLAARWGNATFLETSARKKINVDEVSMTCAANQQDHADKDKKPREKKKCTICKARRGAEYRRHRFCGQDRVGLF
ncbi:hypothetical protein BC829DRAFT_455246 [Chytridium lagenaria]|nr:hypothetical protein BC829DRAFT_455246 [Chytridium lagenaria]